MLKGSGLTLTKKVISSLENRGFVLKGATNKIISQKGGFFNFLGPLMTIGLPLMKNVFTPLAKSVLVPLGLTTAASATDVAIERKFFGLGTTAL